MEEQEWQPVRIAPVERAQECPNEDSESLAVYATWPQQIIRVRPTTIIVDGESMFQIHPDDVCYLPGPGSDLLCSHQILAD